jgi:L-asparagine transporter-like permease
VVSFATISGMWAWIVILICQIRYRAKADRGELPQSSFRAPGAPWTSWFSLAFIALVIVMMGIGRDTRVSLYCAPLWAAVLGVSYLTLRTRNPEGRAFVKR